MKTVSWLVTALLGVALAGLGFIYFNPGYELLLVRSESMKPAIYMGDLIITGPINGPINGEIKEGTVITYERDKKLITHRVLSVEGQTLTTKGDAVEDPDPWSVSLSSVRSVYLFKIPFVGYLTSFVQTKMGWFIMIIIPAALLVGWLAKDIVKEALSEA
ncbi:MAG: signal peptidase I [Chloroflexi bacterium]|nr:signal peptidase I [Chloroflexota bacterium]